MTTATPPRRKWHLQRWLLVLAAAMLAYSGWSTYDVRSALKEARALGWVVEYTDPIEEIEEDWKEAFRKETWLDGVTRVDMPTSEDLEQHRDIAHRLNPKALGIVNAATLCDLSALRALPGLREVVLYGCTGLTNVDGLKKLSSLERMKLDRCTQLSNVDVLKNLSALQELYLTDCTALRSVDALKDLPALRKLDLTGCTGLTNVDVLKNLLALRDIYLTDCTGLTNVDALKYLSDLETVRLYGCTGLTMETVASLQAARPNTRITEP